jgi:transposase
MRTMQSVQKPQQNQDDSDNLSKAQLLKLLAGERTKNNQIESQYRQVKIRLTEQSEHLNLVEKKVDEQLECLRQQENHIRILEELLRLRKIQKFAASSEKMSLQVSLFDEAELESAIEDLMDQAADEIDDEADTHKPAEKKTRKRGFSASLERVRIELALSDAERAGADRTFFTKVKEELEYIPAVLKVLEYWQEKAVFAKDDGSENIMAAGRPVHPLGKCFATTSLLAQIITAKYADGLPLYRQEAS